MALEANELMDDQQSTPVTPAELQVLKDLK